MSAAVWNVEIAALSVPWGSRLLSFPERKLCVTDLAPNRGRKKLDNG